MSIPQLQKLVRDKTGFKNIRAYERICLDFLSLIGTKNFTRIVSPSTPNYIFYQFGQSYAHRITRPINSDVFIEDPRKFATAMRQFTQMFKVLTSERQKAEKTIQANFDPLTIDKVIYTLQQSVGCVSDSFEDTNQSRKRVGQLFENLVCLIIRGVGIDCKPRRVNVPLPGYPGRKMSYELDMVFSRDRAIVTSETKILPPTPDEVVATNEIVGSVKTTSKDRLDKIFLDKFLLSKLLGREVRVVAIFLHDVQRAKKAGNIFGINSTFKSNHFIGYTLALNRLDGVYYVDPRPAMAKELQLAKEIGLFSKFLVHDLWTL